MANIPDEFPSDVCDPCAPTWYIRIGVREYGPFTLRNIQSFITEGRVSSETEIRHPLLTLNQWKNAGACQLLRQSFALNVGSSKSPANVQFRVKPIRQRPRRSRIKPLLPFALVLVVTVIVLAVPFEWFRDDPSIPLVSSAEFRSGTSAPNYPSKSTSDSNGVATGKATAAAKESLRFAAGKTQNDRLSREVQAPDLEPVSVDGSRVSEPQEALGGSEDNRDIGSVELSRFAEQVHRCVN